MLMLMITEFSHLYRMSIFKLIFYYKPNFRINSREFIITREKREIYFHAQNARNLFSNRKFQTVGNLFRNIVRRIDLPFKLMQPTITPKLQ